MNIASWKKYVILLCNWCEFGEELWNLKIQFVNVLLSVMNE
jgi:hypothetical protein